MELIRRAAYKSMPWKNGGGVTEEILVRGDPFVYRVSLAQLAGGGPFSAFPGVDRVIVQLAGEPMTLDHGRHGAHGLTPLVPYRFAGDWTTVGKL